MLAHVLDVCRERPWQRDLHAGVPLVDDGSSESYSKTISAGGP